MSRTISISLALMACIGFSSCKSEQPEPTRTVAPLKSPPPAAPASAEEAPQTPTVHAHMQEHYDKAQLMKQSLIVGNLVAYRQAAAWLAEHELPATAPDNWKERGGVMQEAAKAGRDAVDVRSAAEALGRVGTACAACHKELGRPGLPAGEPPGGGSGAALHMARHQWAADRLWDGLIVPSDPLWIKGAEVMADAPLVPGELEPGQSVAPSVAELATNVHAQAHAARGVPEARRGAAYAEFLVTCASCHESLNLELK